MTDKELSAKTRAWERRMNCYGIAAIVCPVVALPYSLIGGSGWGHVALSILMPASFFFLAVTIVSTIFAIKWVRRRHKSRMASLEIVGDYSKSNPQKAQRILNEIEEDIERNK